MKTEWITMGKLRRQLSQRWVVLGFLILILLIIQAVFGQYTGMLLLVSGWFVFLFFPFYGILLASYRKFRYPDQAVRRGPGQNLRMLEWGYLILVLVTILLSQAAVSTNGWSTQQYFLYSLIWLLPINVLLCGSTYMVLVSTVRNRLPNSQGIRQLAEKMLAQAQSVNATAKSGIIKMVTVGKLAEAINALIKYYQGRDTTTRDHLTMLHGQLTKLTEDSALGLLETEKLNVRRNRLALALLNIMEGLPANAEQ